MIFLTGCQSNPKTVYHNYQVPEVYLTKCKVQFEDDTFKEVILGLDKTIGCYESKQKGLKSFLEQRGE